MQYSILTFNFGNYDLIREPFSISDNVECVMVTDCVNLPSNSKWKFKRIPSEYINASGFTKSFYVRYHPFEFVNNDICLVIDGSVQILKSPDPLIDDFMASGSDICLSVNRLCNPFNDEYDWFVNKRHYDREQCAKNMAMTMALGYSKSYKGYFEAGVKIVMNSMKTSKLHTCVWNILNYISPSKMNIDRLDQTILSGVVNFKLPDLTIFPISRQVIKSDYLMWMNHGKNTIADKDFQFRQKMWVRNKLNNIYYLQ